MRRTHAVRKGASIEILAAALLASIGAALPASANEADATPLLGLPEVRPSSAADEQRRALKVEIGKTIFFDKSLSRDGTISCASCHQPERAYADGKTLAEGIGKSTGSRNTPSILNAAFNHSQFWDGRRNTLEAQALDPMTNPLEHGLSDQADVLRIICGERRYRELFKAAFAADADTVSVENIGIALAEFERAKLLAGDSAFDRYYFAHDKAALEPAAIRGLELFMGQAQCASCHTIEKSYAVFTDNDFHSLRIGFKKIEQRLPELTTRIVAQRNQARAMDREILLDRDLAELGRFAVTLKPADIGKFRTPSLRNVALTAPYMHDGSVATLEEAIEQEVYYRGAESGHPLILTPSEKQDLLAFLNALTSREIPKF